MISKTKYNVYSFGRKQAIKNDEYKNRIETKFMCEFDFPKFENYSVAQNLKGWEIGKYLSLPDVHLKIEKFYNVVALNLLIFLFSFSSFKILIHKLKSRWIL